MAGLRAILRFHGIGAEDGAAPPGTRTRRRKLAPPPPRQHSNSNQVRQARRLRLRQLLAGAVNLARFRQALPLGTRPPQRRHIPAGDHARCGDGPPEQRRPGHSLAQRNPLIAGGRRRLRAGDQLPAGMQNPADSNRRKQCSRPFQHPAAMRLTFTWHRSPEAAAKHRANSRRPSRRHPLTAPPPAAPASGTAGTTLSTPGMADHFGLEVARERVMKKATTSRLPIRQALDHPGALRPPGGLDAGRWPPSLGRRRRALG